MKLLANWILNALAILSTAYLLDGVHVDGLATALVLSVVLGIINTILKPILLFFTLPITIMTLGMFTLVINALLVMLASEFVAGFSVDGFLPALLFSIVLSVVNWFLYTLVR